MCVLVENITSDRDVVVLFFVIAVRCDRLIAPTNGRVEAPLRTVNSQAIYFCDDGYFLQGPSSRICQSNGDWSGNAPVCVGEFVFLVGDLSFEFLIQFKCACM